MTNTMKNIFLITVLFAFCLSASAQTNAENIVNKFGSSLQYWCATKDIEYRSKAQAQCSEACRVMDKIMEDYAFKSGLNIKNYVIPNYLNCFEKAMNDGTINIAFSNVRSVSKDKFAVYSYSSVKAEAKKMNELEFAACDVSVSGAISYKVRDLYYIQHGKIVKITPYEEITDNKTGEKKVKIDISDMIDDFFFDIVDGDYNALGCSLGYSKSFPINFGVHYNWKLLNLALEIGYNWDKDAYCIKQDGNDFETIKKKGYYFVVTPGIFLQYVTINFGVGAASWERERDFNVSIGNSNTSVYMSTNIKDEKTFFLMKPSVEFNIPIAEDKWSDPCVFICPRVGYLHVPQLKKANCWEFGICCRVIIAD